MKSSVQFELLMSTAAAWPEKKCVFIWKERSMACRYCLGHPGWARCGSRDKSPGICRSVPCLGLFISMLFQPGQDLVSFVIVVV